MNLKNVTLEISLKPFWNPDPGNCRAVCDKMFRQWEPLLRHSDTVSLQLWIGDGSEILDYRGLPKDTFEWARYIGCASREPSRERLEQDPECLQVHTRARPYRDDPPVFDYGFLQKLVGIMKESGESRLGKKILVGATFDPGPEFVKSVFKYERHPEICTATFGDSKNDVVSCAAVLKADERSYAGFPDGIHDGTPFGVFLGRQTRCFLADMGMDFIWFSNGFGFGHCPWGYTGLLFDNKEYCPEKAAKVREEMMEFWRLFKKECPETPVFVRGTNMSTGIDLSSDGVPLREIYSGGFICQPPVNSPWAALNMNLGLELVGWMSHIAELPEHSYAFRFYTHDPWWMNSPWLDRYERQPYDIFLPLAVSRIDAGGKVEVPSSVNFLTADDSLGNMPEQVPNEVMPRLMECLESTPDEPGPLVWVYPFDEYHEWIEPQTGRIDEVMFGDCMIMDALNRGLPLNTVVSSANFVLNRTRNPEFLAGNVLISPVPEAGSEWERCLLEHAAAGGNVMVYGSMRHAGKGLMETLGLMLARPVDGKACMELDGEISGLLDDFGSEGVFEHSSIVSGGGMEEIGGRHVLAATSQDAENRSYAVEAETGNGRLVWLRGSVSRAFYVDPPRHIREREERMPSETERLYPERLFTALLDRFGWRFAYRRGDPVVNEPVVAVSRHRNGFWFSGMNHNTLVEHELRTPFGAPIMNGYETRLSGGAAFYRFPRTWRHECRVFVKQDADGIVSCRENCSSLRGTNRWMVISGLQNAELSVFPEPGAAETLRVIVDPKNPYVDCRHIDTSLVRQNGASYFKTGEKVSGKVLVCW